MQPDLSTAAQIDRVLRDVLVSDPPPGYPYVIGRDGGDPEPAGDILSRIDATVEAVESCGCGCGRRLDPSGPSPFFASDACQRRYHERHATDPGEVLNRPDAASVHPGADGVRVPLSVPLRPSSTARVLASAQQRARLSRPDYSAAGLDVEAAVTDARRMMADQEQVGGDFAAAWSEFVPRLPVPQRCRWRVLWHSVHASTWTDGGRVDRIVRRGELLPDDALGLEIRHLRRMGAIKPVPRSAAGPAHSEPAPVRLPWWRRLLRRLRRGA